jgi:hypothetical protein
LKQEQERYRVLIAATRDECIEVWADPQVKVVTICIPETKTDQEYEQALEWALKEVPQEFRTMMDDAYIRPELFSVHCMDKIHWRSLNERLEHLKWLEALETSVSELKEK